MRKLLIVSDSGQLHTGQARVVSELAQRFLTSGVDVVVAGWWHQLAGSDFDLPYPIIPASKEQQDALLPILRSEHPDSVLAIGDPWDFQWLAGLRSRTNEFRLYGYLSMSSAVPSKMEQVIDGFDVLATTSEYGAKQIGRHYVPAIHLGVDMAVFRPTDPQDIFLGRKSKDLFVVLVNAQNTFRKNLVAAVRGFTQFARGKSNVVCYMNTVAKPNNGSPGADLVDLIIRLDAEKLFSFNLGNLGPVGVTDDILNRIYSVSTALLCTSMTEGFGLPLLEAMATRTVPIAPDAYSATELLTEGRGVLYPAATEIVSSPSIR